MNQEGLQAARVLMGDSLGFHIIFVMFGLTLPLLVVWFEWMSIRRKDKKLREVARFWSKVMTLVAITGVISGTVVALQMSLVWPGILKFGGKVIGLPFMFETYFFLIEAIFLSLYMTTWESKRISARLHWFFGWMVVVSSIGTAFVITSVDAWMNLPTGFDIVAGKFTNIDVFGAMFSQTSVVMFLHSMVGYLLASSLAIAGLYTLRLLAAQKHNLGAVKHELDWFIVHKLLIFSAIMVIGAGFTGHMTAQYVAAHGPTKLAAIELNQKTGPNASIILGGVPGADGRATGPYIEIPGALSLLSCNSPNCVVSGLDNVPQKDRPPLYIHVLFDVKMLLVAIVMGAVMAYFVLHKWKQSWLRSRLLLGTFAATSWLGIAIVELGWMLTEIGRQPWSVHGYVLTADAITKSHSVYLLAWIFPTAYLVLAVVTWLGLRRLVNDEKTRVGGTL